MALSKFNEFRKTLNDQEKADLNDNNVSWLDSIQSYAEDEEDKEEEKDDEFKSEVEGDEDDKEESEVVEEKVEEDDKESELVVKGVDLSDKKAFGAYKKELLDTLDPRLSLKWKGSKYWSKIKKTNTITLQCKVGQCATTLKFVVSNNGSGTLLFTDRCSHHTQ